ncbi:MAG TPA: hypothetical protein VHX62_04260 [Solirubrobacteraceae bacterium]|nr:hypothetical protein [Solirubrobacteraceae bacterium]
MTDRSAATRAPFAAGTVVTSDYLPWARVLATSFAAHHSGARLVVALLDEPEPSRIRDDDPFELVRPAEIGLTGAPYEWMRAIYDGFELSCAVKPWLLRHLLTGADAALYLDSDILVCDSLAPIAERASHAGVVLTPHTLTPLPDDGLLPSEDTLLRLGQFNAGFVAVGHAGGEFLDWWGERLARECIGWSERQPMRFVDQRWLDLALNYFPVHVLRDPGANVAYWNAGTRRLDHGPDGYRVDGEPLRFMHFSGFDPGRPNVLSKHAGEPPRADARTCPPLAALCADYAARLAQAGLDPATGGGRPAPELAGAFPLTPPVRAAVRAALVATERAAGMPAPDPGDAAAVLTWLRAPATAGATSWYLLGLHASHIDVSRAFPQVPGGDEERYQAWSAREGVAFGLVPLGLGGGAPAVALDDARAFVALVNVGELLSDPGLFAGLADSLSAADDVTIVIHDPGRTPAAFAEALQPLLEALGLDGPGAPDLLGLLQPAGPAAVAPLAHAVLTRRVVPEGLAHLPRAADPAALRRLAEGAASPRRLPAAGHVQ